MAMTRIVPMLPVHHLAASVMFYEKLGFVVEQRNDQWGWAKLKMDDCAIMLDQSINGHPPVESGTRASVLYLYPDDIERYHAQVRAAGVSIPDLDVTFYGMNEFRIEDPDGNRLWIGQNAPAQV